MIVPAVNRRRFSWLAFAATLLVMSALGYRWYLLRHYSEHGWDINWYRSMVTPVFYSLSVGLPLVTAFAVGRLMTFRRKGTTIAAIATVAAAALILLVAVPIFTAWDAQHGAMAERTCMRNLQQLAIATQGYAQENGGCLPRGDEWTEAVLHMGDYEHLLHCPADDSSAGASYALNAEASGKRLEALPERLPLFFDATQPAARPDQAQFRHPRRWGQIVPIEPGVMVIYADGRPAWVSRSEWLRRFAEE